jgi:hypothetical protein
MAFDGCTSNKTIGFSMYVRHMMFYANLVSSVSDFGTMILNFGIWGIKNGMGHFVRSIFKEPRTSSH